MADHLTEAERSWNMSRIRSRDTSIEMMVRKELFARGFRFRKNDKRYPGTPDVILPKYKTAIFIHGCFWHRHQDCKIATTPKTNTDYWTKKFAKNVENDEKHKMQLIEQGWQVFVIWQCEIEKDLKGTVDHLIESIIQCKEPNDE